MCEHCIINPDDTPIIFNNYGSLLDSSCQECLLTDKIRYETHEVLKKAFEQELKQLGID